MYVYKTFFVYLLNFRKEKKKSTPILCYIPMSIHPPTSTSHWQTLKLFKYYHTMRLIVCTGMDNLYSNILNKYTLQNISHSLTTTLKKKTRLAIKFTSFNGAFFVPSLIFEKHQTFASIQSFPCLTSGSDNVVFIFGV